VQHDPPLSRPRCARSSSTSSMPRRCVRARW
jgi:hypothetical protein